MFSGIVEAKGKVSKVTQFDDYLRVEISAPKGF
jgi:riboflavin synthase alpha subunit